MKTRSCRNVAQSAGAVLAMLLAAAVSGGCSHNAAPAATGDAVEQTATDNVAATPQSASGAEEPSFSIERVNRGEQIPAGVPVQFENHWGDLRIRTTHRGGLLLQGIVQKIGSDRDEFEIAVDRHAGHTAIVVKALVRDPAGRVDLTAYVPPGHELSAATSAGLAEVKYSGPVRVRSNTGNVIVKTDSSASAQTTSGFIAAVLTGAHRTDASNFVSTSGNIEVVVSADSAFELMAATTGAVNVDIADEATTRREQLGSTVHMVVNEGATPLQIASESGNILVRSLPMSGPILNTE